MVINNERTWIYFSSVLKNQHNNNGWVVAAVEGKLKEIQVKFKEGKCVGNKE